MFAAIGNFLYGVLDGINGVVQNYGVSIIIFTILMRLVCLPFDYKSRKGMRKMSAVQPKIAALQKKYQNDPKKLQQKQAELMRKEGYNPLSGCLPLLLTWPLMIAMFAAMRSIANEQLARQTFAYLAGETEVIRPAETFLWVKNIWMTDSPFTSIAPNLQSLQLLGQDVWQKAFAELSEGQIATLSGLGITVDSFATKEAMQTTVESMLVALGNVPAYVEAMTPVPGWANINALIFRLTLYKQYNGLLILPIAAGVAQVLQTKYNPQMKEQENVQPANGQGKGMGNFMKYFFPILSVYFCLSSNAGFALYWVTSTAVMWVQSIILTKVFEKQEAKKAETVNVEGSVK
ncbi:MAG: YidC/Oxa1 family membrane protein insertase [Clostridia bacterium]|nr:YidC/Oxa1 family membrane protein insertase [Clostridia bacterium]